MCYDLHTAAAKFGGKFFIEHFDLVPARAGRGITISKMAAET